MQHCLSDGILKQNRTKTFPLAGKTVETGIHNPCNWQIFPCETLESGRNSRLNSSDVNVIYLCSSTSGYWLRSNLVCASLQMNC